MDAPLVKRKRKIGDKNWPEELLPAFGQENRRQLAEMIGRTVHAPVSEMPFFLLRQIVSGHAGIVYKAKRLSDGRVFALKIPKKDKDKQIWKLRIEKDRNEVLAELGVPHAEITEEGKDYIMKDWVEGVRGDEWFKMWNTRGRPLDEPAFLQLMELFDTNAANGVYIQNLKDLNLIHDGNHWVIVDVGYIVQGLTPLQALERFYDTFDHRWRYPQRKSYARMGCPDLSELRGAQNPFPAEEIMAQRQVRIAEEEARDQRLAAKRARKEDRDKKQARKKKRAKKTGNGVSGADREEGEEAIKQQEEVTTLVRTEDAVAEGGEGQEGDVTCGEGNGSGSEGGEGAKGKSNKEESEERQQKKACAAGAKDKGKSAVAREKKRKKNAKGRGEENVGKGKGGRGQKRKKKTGASEEGDDATEEADGARRGGERRDEGKIKMKNSRMQGVR